MRRWPPLPRAGIIHRLDKDTSGLLVVARTLEAHTALTRQLAARSVSREYLAVCVGRHDRRRQHRCSRSGAIAATGCAWRCASDGRPAMTHYRVLERFRAHSYLRVKLETGRTHQIRLHLAHLKYPIVGDPVYGGRFGRPRGATRGTDRRPCTRFKRQALHAASLAFDHPRSGKRLTLHSAVPPDFAGLLACTARRRARCRRCRDLPRAPHEGRRGSRRSGRRPPRCARCRRCAAAG